MPTKTHKIPICDALVSVQGPASRAGSGSTLKDSHVAAGLLCTPGVAVLALPKNSDADEVAGLISSGHRLLAGGPTVTADTLFDAPIRQAEVRRSEGTKRCYVVLGLEFDPERWKLRGSGFLGQELTLVRAPLADAARAAELDDLLKQAKRPDRGWFDLAAKALANDPGSHRPFPFVPVQTGPDGSGHYPVRPVRNPWCGWLVNCRKKG